MNIKGAMLDPAQELTKRLSCEFDPVKFSDRYEHALAELIRAKAEGRKIPAPKIDLMEALRKSAAA